MSRTYLFADLYFLHSAPCGVAASLIASDPYIVGLAFLEAGDLLGQSAGFLNGHSLRT